MHGFFQAKFTVLHIPIASTFGVVRPGCGCGQFLWVLLVKSGRGSSKTLLTEIHAMNLAKNDMKVASYGLSIEFSVSHEWIFHEA